MCDIKFRGKWKLTGKWVKGYLYVTPSGKHYIVGSAEHNPPYWEVDPETVEQHIRRKTGEWVPVCLHYTMPTIEANNVEEEP